MLAAPFLCRSSGAFGPKISFFYFFGGEAAKKVEEAKVLTPHYFTIASSLPLFCSRQAASFGVQYPCLIA